MTQQIPYSNTKLDKVMNPDQFNQVVEAILAGKYSWACLLILRFAGYNPLHYIPYRTYNRLIKENCQNGRASGHRTDKLKFANQSSETEFDNTSTSKCLSKINDLSYLEVVDQRKTDVQGGTLEQWLNIKIREYDPIKVELKPGYNQDLLSTIGDLFDRTIHHSR